MNSDPLTSHYIRTFTAAELVQELCDRGALKVLQRMTYLPGIVKSRYPEDAAVSATQRAVAETVHNFTRDLLSMKVLDVEIVKANTLPQYNDMPPGDEWISVSLLVPNPSFDEALEGEEDDYDPED